jgi:hypothetical protein
MAVDAIVERVAFDWLASNTGLPSLEIEIGHGAESFTFAVSPGLSSTVVRLVSESFCV